MNKDTPTEVTTVKHPSKIGFKLGLKVNFADGRIKRIEPYASAKDVVYVALLPANGPTIKRGEALKVGQTGGSLFNRWRGIARIFKEGAKIKGNERGDRDRLLELAGGHEVSVWVRPAGKVRIPYARGLTTRGFSTRCAEEEFLDHYYAPQFGKSLNRVSV